MYKLGAGIAGFVTLLILTPGVVLAKNYCIGGFFNTSYILVGQGFTVPAKGKCKQWTGFNAEGPLATAGVGCTSSDGSHLLLTLTTGAESGGWAEADAINLSLPSQTGDASSQVLEAGSVFSGPSSGISGGVCTTKTIPAAIERGAAAPRPSGVR